MVVERSASGLIAGGVIGSVEGGCVEANRDCRAERAVTAKGLPNLLEIGLRVVRVVRDGMARSAVPNCRVEVRIVDDLERN